MALKNKLNIIVTGSDGGFGNLGDEWLLSAVKNRYKLLKNKYRVIILMAHPPRFKLDGFMYIEDNLEAFKRQNINIDSILAVHFYGGGYINSYWIKDKLWLYEHLSSLGLPGGKIFFTSLGLGPLSKKETKYIDEISNQVALFGVRDRYFSGQIKSIFMFDESINTAPIEYIKSKKNELWVNFRIANHVGINREKLNDFLINLERFAELNDLEIKYFSMIKGFNFDEKKEMEEALRSIGIYRKVKKRARNYKILLRQFKRAAMVVTTSYHATLASIYTHTPVVSIYENDYYKIKFEGLARVVATSLLRTLAIDTADSNLIIFEKSLKSYDSKISNTLSRLRRYNNKAYKEYEEFLSVKNRRTAS